MKKLALLLFSMACCATSFATVRIVDNNFASPQTYTTMDAAITASAIGDTIYVQGSNTTYGAVTVNKQLTVIGPGYDVSGYNSGLLNATFDALWIDSTVLFQTVAGTHVIGFNINQFVIGGSTINPTIKHNIKNCIIERCKLSAGATYGDATTIRNNVFLVGGNGGNNTCRIDGSYCIVENNIIYGNLFVSTTGVSSGHTISNNIFYLGGLITIQNSVVSNNIFLSSSSVNGMASFTNTSGCTFSNNMTYGTVSVILPPANNNGTSNLSNTNPNFINTPAIGSWSSTTIFGYNLNFNTGSAAINAGSDGTNIGVTGGAYAINDFTGAPPLPQMQQLNINNAVINQGQSLNVNFKARKMN